LIDFACNICGRANTAVGMHRELAPCAQCGSNARFRAMMVGLSLGLFGQVLPLPKMIADRGIRGWGCSDAEIYANRLVELFDYTNTFLHTEPRADIGDAATLEIFRGCQFILCSDVLEHVLVNPVDAIANMYDCLTPDGCLILSAPSYAMQASVEKYPTLRGFSVVAIGGRHAVVYETATGALGFDPDPVFHGGPGSVLEMRLFGHEALLREIRNVGFRRVDMVGDEAQPFGAVWPHAAERSDLPYAMDGRVIVARK
jgi:SAM-dependent methyltransferase